MPYLYRRILGSFLSDLKSGKLKPGDRLPTEQEIASKFDVSRITAKRAMEELQRRGLIERYRGRGSFVREVDSNALDDANDVHDSIPTSHHERTIGFVTWRISEHFGMELLRGIEEYCQLHGINLLIGFSNGNVDTETDIVRRWRRSKVDGILAIPVMTETHNPEFLRATVDRYPTVLIDRELVGSGLPTVRTDHYRASYDITKWMIGKKPHHILCLATDPGVRGLGNRRYQGFRDAIVESGEAGSILESELIFDSSDLYTSNTLHTETVVDRVRQRLLDEPEIDAVYATTGRFMCLALSAVNSPSLSDRKIQVFGFPTTLDMFCARRVPHVLQNEHLNGRMAAEMLDRVISGEEIEPLVLIPHRLVV